MKGSVWLMTLLTTGLSVAAIGPAFAQSQVPSEPIGSPPVVAVEPARYLGIDTLLFRDTFVEPLWASRSVIPAASGTALAR